MAVLPITAENIKKIINDEDLKSFKVTIENLLGINDIGFEIQCEDVAIDDGYPNHEKNARTQFTFDFEKFEGLFFCIESIADFINYRIGNNVSNRNDIIKCYLKYLILHELMHIKQFKDYTEGKRTKEEMGISDKTPDKDSIAEKEADSFAHDYLQKNCIFFEEMKNIFLT